MIQLIMTDIDGTLTEEGSMQLNPEYFTVMRELVEEGIVVVVGSGRHMMGIEPVFGHMKDVLWFASQNGAAIVHGNQSRILKHMPKETVLNFWKDVHTYSDGHAEVFVETAEKSYCPFDGTPMYDLLINKYHYDAEVTGSVDSVPDKDFSIMILYHPESAEAFFQKCMPQKWAEELTITTSGKYWVDIAMPGINKGVALSEICKELKIPLENTIAFGDNKNDIVMLKTAGIGYAVDNACQEVQDAANRIIPGYKEDGVLVELKRILKETKERNAKKEEK